MTTSRPSSAHHCASGKALFDDRETGTHQWLGLCPAHGLVPHHGPMGASVSSDVQVQDPGRSASPCSPDHTALALSQGEWVLPGATDLHRDVGLAAVTHSLTQPFDPLLFLKSKQQSGNRPNSSGIGPRTGSPFFKKIYFLFFFFFKQHQKQIHSPYQAGSQEEHLSKERPWAHPPRPQPEQRGWVSASWSPRGRQKSYQLQTMQEKPAKPTKQKKPKKRRGKTFF